MFYDYKIKKVKIQNKIISSRDISGRVHFNWSEVWEEKNFIETVENILKNIPKEDSKILVSVYLENKMWEDFNYSYSAFYKRLKKAEKTFLSFLN
ncbi:hypothetical protein D8X55_01140 [Malacoplasma penetrans]|uniref:MG284/MPN403 family protein n=1 Tax=Malacoplasma penetrans TaxID=28227 RepID=UPI0003049B8B|nr:hypothetical protein [Malacoplasma penetrans]RXY97067.1 hypothetical protein D8X55_01140 [Malacoplasma penetrans]